MRGNAREAVLSRIRAALQDREPESSEAITGGWEAIPRDYDQTASLTPRAKLDLLEERLRDYGVEVTRVADHDVAGAIRWILATRGNRPTLLPSGFPDAWTPRDAHLIVDDDFSARELDCFDGVVTGAVVAIAETGSLVLQNVAGQGRRAATLMPDFHLCVVRTSDVVENLPQAFARLGETAVEITTFVSGPSATADIEMTRIEGVHGPRCLHVVLAGSELARPTDC